MPSQQRVVVVITEGASRELLTEFIDQGYLPGFSKLLQQGAWGELASHVIPYEPPGLMTAFTGSSSAEHGWYSYWTVHEPDHKPRVLSSADLQVKPFWLRPEHSSRHFSIINVLGSHPPIAMPGETITYPMGQTLKASYPGDLLASLAKKGFHYTHDVSIWYKGQERNEFVSRIVEADRRRAALALHFYQEGSEVVIVNLTSIDRACHYYWQELEPGACVTRGESAILAAFQCADELIEKLLDCLDDRTTLLAFSEIGFGPLKAYLSINEILAKAGFLKWKQPGTVVDWEHTIAAEAVQGSSGVNINLQGRYADGTVSVPDYERVRAEVAAALRTSINPYTGLNLFASVTAREEVYEGPLVQGAPDLILFPEDHRYLPLGDPVWALHVNRPLQSGWHRDRSYWASVGPKISAGQRPDPASLLQVLPSIEYALGAYESSEQAPLFAEDMVAV
ncbi:MAG TPA: alkaline phosphatase family protein [Candidatus Angelobacter sp.]|nr:alkaline phosphatase family protein [Candidatus Angelobacter sp.]